MKYKVTLPVLLLLLVAGQMSAEFCMARCQGMRMTEPACAMHEMAHGHCAPRKHASINGMSTSLSTLGTCSGQACNSALELMQNRTDPEVKPLVVAISSDILISPILERTRQVHFRDARSTRSIPPFDPLISSLRVWPLSVCQQPEDWVVAFPCSSERFCSASRL
jgi:hypothetical protein